MSELYAIAEDRSRQVTCRSGETLLLDFNDRWTPGAEVVLDRVLLLGGEPPKVGTPYVSGAKVVLEVRGEVQGDKIYVGKFRRRKNYERKTGFRAKYTEVVVKSIEA
jgi:large subunit ribosomal protein L21